VTSCVDSSQATLPSSPRPGPGGLRGTEHHPGSHRRRYAVCSRPGSDLLLSLPVPIRAPVAILPAKLRCKGGSNLSEGLLTSPAQQTPADGPGPVNVRGIANANHSEGEEGMAFRQSLSSQLPVRPNSPRSIMPTTGSSTVVTGRWAGVPAGRGDSASDRLVPAWRPFMFNAKAGLELPCAGRRVVRLRL
jgi:hypothetical protein